MSSKVRSTLAAVYRFIHAPTDAFRLPFHALAQRRRYDHGDRDRARGRQSRGEAVSLSRERREGGERWTVFTLRGLRPSHHAARWSRDDARLRYERTHRPRRSARAARVLGRL